MLSEDKHTEMNYGTVTVIVVGVFLAGLKILTYVLFLKNVSNKYQQRPAQNMFVIAKMYLLFVNGSSIEYFTVTTTTTSIFVL